VAPRASTTKDPDATSRAAQGNQHRRAYGNVRKRASGRYEVRYTGPDGERRPGGTFPTRQDAEAGLAAVLTDVYRGAYRAPELGAVQFGAYARRWLDRQHDLRPQTRKLYEDVLATWVLARHVLEGTRSSRAVDLSLFEVRALSPALVAEWFAAVVAGTRISAQRQHAATLTDAQAARAWARETGRPVAAAGRLPAAVLLAWRAAGCPRPVPEDLDPDAGRTRAATAYRLLRTICSAAVREELLATNPCQIPKAGQVRAAERVPATPAEVEAIAAAITPRYAAAVHVAAWSGLRGGELFALQRRHVDLARGTVRVERSLVEVTGRPVSYGPPKSDAGRRTVHLPASVVAVLAEHLDAYTGPNPGSLVFTTVTGRPLRKAQRSKMFARARAAAGRPDLRWHDLRHTGATLAAATGASLRDLQRRLGHSTVAAALVYQHASDDSDRRLAERLEAQRRPAAAEALDNLTYLPRPRR
jgi:integrase